jgi:oligopeptidase B
VQEWGNPAENEEVYGYIRSYSPVDNVRAQVYPDMLLTGGALLMLLLRIYQSC